MTTTLQLLDAWKLRRGITSDNQAALALGIARQTVSGWRKDRRHASAPVAARLAKDLELDELRTLAAIEAERAVDADTKRTWSRLAGKALSVAVLAFAGLGAALLPAPAYAASEGVLARSAHNVCIFCQRLVRRRRYFPGFPAVA